MAKPNSTKLIELRNKAKREGWAKWIRQGSGEEADEKAMLNGCRFDLNRCNHWLEFAEEYGTLTEGAWRGQKFSLLPWQSTETGRLFGWVKHSPEWGFDVRRFRIWFAELPKKQGKTPLLSLIGNYLFFADCVNQDGSPRQINLYNAATSRKQADRLLVHSVRQIKNSDELSRAATIKRLEGFWSVSYRDNEWNVVAADPASADGVNGHCLADEFHRWKGFEFYNSIKWMIASQPEGVFATITTAGEQGENVWQYTHDHTLAVNAGTVIDESFYGVIYAADRKDDPHDEATWFKANPSLGTNVTSPLKLSTFRADYESAKADPTSWPAFLRLRLGVSQNQTNTWVDNACVNGFADWDSGPTARAESTERIDCYEEFTDSDLQKTEATSITLALDLASVRDTVAASLSICDESQIVRNKTWFWLPEKEAMRQAKRVSYKRWADGGFITLTPGDVIDYRKLLNDLIDICELHKVTRFYFDPLFQAEWLTQELEQATGAERVAFPQTIIHYAPLVKEAERRIISHTIRHCGNPVMSWQISNAISYENANGDRRIKKRNGSDYRKVDGVQAMIMSLQDSVAAQTFHFYENNEVETI